MTVKFIIARFSLFYKGVFPCLLPLPPPFQRKQPLRLFSHSFPRQKKSAGRKKFLTFDGSYV